MDHVIYHHLEERNHHHLVRSKCGKIIDSDRTFLASVEKLLAENINLMLV
jgi:Fe2+ or Zn2+ uptake regulation protein